MNRLLTDLLNQLQAFFIVQRFDRALKLVNLATSFPSNFNIGMLFQADRVKQNGRSLRDCHQEDVEHVDDLVVPCHLNLSAITRKFDQFDIKRF